MGKQSARLYYDGRDHKDIYFQGNYHEKMYKGGMLVWEKLYEDYFSFVWIVKERQRLCVLIPDGKEIAFSSNAHSVYITSPLIKSSEYITKGDTGYIYYSKDGRRWKRIKKSGQLENAGNAGASFEEEHGFFSIEGVGYEIYALYYYELDTDNKSIVNKKLIMELGKLNKSNDDIRTVDNVISRENGKIFFAKHTELLGTADYITFYVADKNGNVQEERLPVQHNQFCKKMSDIISVLYIDGYCYIFLYYWAVLPIATTYDYFPEICVYKSNDYKTWESKTHYYLTHEQEKMNFGFSDVLHGKDGIYIYCQLKNEFRIFFADDPFAEFKLCKRVTKSSFVTLKVTDDDGLGISEIDFFYYGSAVGKVNERPYTYDYITGELAIFSSQNQFYHNGAPTISDGFIFGFQGLFDGAGGYNNKIVGVVYFDNYFFDNSENNFAILSQV